MQNYLDVQPVKINRGHTYPEIVHMCFDPPEAESIPTGAPFRVR